MLDVGVQFGALAIYATELGCRAAALDYGMYEKAFHEVVADHGVDYRKCDLGQESLPFPDNSFDFVTYTDVIEHHALSPKRILAEIHGVLGPSGRLILVTPNHASVYNRIKLRFGASVNDEFDYSFNASADTNMYDVHHREFTREEIKSALEQTKFRVLECRVIDDDSTLLLNYRQRVGRPKSSSDAREIVMRLFEKIWSTMRMPLDRWICSVGEKTSVQ